MKPKTLSENVAILFLVAMFYGAAAVAVIVAGIVGFPAPIVGAGIGLLLIATWALTQASSIILDLVEDAEEDAETLARKRGLLEGD